MARIETDPNYTTPTFPRATTGPDIFKKEDVQKLAEAVSGHVHDATAHGLAINPQANTIHGHAIVSGTIESLQIADGTIIGTDIQDASINASTKLFPGSIASHLLAPGAVQGSNLAANSVATANIVSGAVSNYNGMIAVVPFSTTTVGSWVATPVSVTFVTSGGGVFLWFAFNATYAAAVNDYFRVGISIDGGGAVTLQSSSNAVANQNHRIGAIYLATGLSAASHTFTVYVTLSAAGTFSLDGVTPAQIVLLEMKR